MQSMLYVMLVLSDSYFRGVKFLGGVRGVRGPEAGSITAIRTGAMSRQVPRYNMAAARQIGSPSRGCFSDDSLVAFLHISLLIKQHKS